MTQQVNQEHEPKPANATVQSQPLQEAKLNQDVHQVEQLVENHVQL